MQGLLGGCTSGEGIAGLTFHLSLNATRQFLSEEIALQKVEAGDGGREPREVLAVC